MTVVGMAHFLLMIGALGVGSVVLLMPKGNLKHRRLGRVFVAGMVVSNVIVLGIYEDSGQPGIFHVLAIVSLVSIASAIVLVRLPTAGLGFRIAHGHVMLWSYGGLVAAGLGQGASAFSLSPWLVILACFLLVALVAYRTDFAGMLDGS